MPVERLTAEDRVMIWADRIWPQDIGALAILEGAISIEAVKAVVAARLEGVPRFRQVLRVPDRRLGGPYWTDDPAFDLGNHLRTVGLPAQADEATLLTAVEALRRTRLDPARPLWEMWLLTGLPAGRTGLFVRTHHSVADGIAGVATLASFLDTEPDSTPAGEAVWQPAPGPTEAELAADARTRRRAARQGRLSSIVHPMASARRLTRALPALHELFAEPSIPATALDRRVGAARQFATVRTRLDVVKAIARADGAKVNDVFLAAISGGLRRLFAARGERPPEIMRAYVPVSLRQGRYAGARGNSIAEMVVPLPTGVADPLTALSAIGVETAKRKARARPSVGGLPTHGLAGLVMLKLIDRQHVNVATADLPGPPVPLYLAGARLAELFPIIPLIGNVPLGIGAISYAGAFDIGIVADPETVPDIDAMAAGVSETLAALERSVRAAA